jgi:hypothetical protein
MKRYKKFDHYNRENNFVKKPKLEVVKNQETIYEKTIELEKKINEIGFIIMQMNNKLDQLIKQKECEAKYYYYN